jgi:uncharacterized protein YcbK (DUF882 family)
MLTKAQKTNVQVTKNFNLSELEFRNTIPPAMIADATTLLKQLQVLRDYLGASITIISGYRAPDYNASINGASNSQHMYARAADIKVAGKTSLEVHAAISKLIKEGKMLEGGLGVYDLFCHYDCRTIAGLPAARWRELTSTK